MTDNRFPSPGNDTRFPAPGTDTRFSGYPIDARFPSPGVDTRFEGGRTLWNFEGGDAGPFETFTRTSAGTAFTTTGLVVTFSTGVPRVTNKGLLLEGAAINVQRYSEDFTQWSKIGTGAGLLPVVTLDAGLAPDGTMTADRVAFSLAGASGSNAADRSQVVVTTTALRSGDQFAGAIWALGTAGETIKFRQATGVAYMIFTFNGSWQRLYTTETSFTTEVSMEVGLRQAPAVATTCLLWGAGLEVGNLPTSYIKTGASQASRSAESATLKVPAGCTQWDAVYGDARTATSGSGLTPGASFDLVTGRPWVGLGKELKSIRFKP